MKSKKKKEVINQNLTDQDIVYLYFRNKQDLDEYNKSIVSDDEYYLDIVRDQHYKLCKALNNRLEVLVRSILKKDPELLENIKLILNPEL